MTDSARALLSRRLGAALLAAVLAAAGCGERLPKVYPVKGRVVNKGRGHVKDLAGYNVQLQSVSDPKEMPGGPVEEDGTFTLYTLVGTKAIPGVKEGTYKACLMQPPVEGGKPPPLVIPARYTRFETSQLEFKIPAPNNEITIEVDRDAR